LPAETDPKDKQISALTAQIAELKKSHASVEIQFSDNGQGSLAFEVPRHRAIAPDLIEPLMEYVTTLHPKLTGSPGFYGMQLAHWGASNSSIQSYDTVEYPQWRVAVQAHFENLADRLNSVWMTPDLGVTLTCTRGVPAYSLTVRLRAKGNVVLRMPGKEARKECQDRLTLPQPPELNPFGNIPRSLFDPISLPLACRGLDEKKIRFMQSPIWPSGGRLRKTRPTARWPPTQAVKCKLEYTLTALCFLRQLSTRRRRVWILRGG
jgi:hypothetical protein